MKTIRRILAVTILILVTATVYAQRISLGMSKEVFVQLYGLPDKEVLHNAKFTDEVLMFYGDDFLRFSDNKLVTVVVQSNRFTLDFFRPEGVTVGDSFTELQKSTGSAFELISTDAGLYRFFWTSEDKSYKIHISVVKGKVFDYGLVRLGNEMPVSMDEYYAFFEENFAPKADVPDSTLWPARIHPLWKEAECIVSKDSASATCCIPFIPQFNATARYADACCPGIARRLVLTKCLDGSNIFRQSFVSIVPKAGLKRGDPFDGIIFYNNVNNASTFAWECYENGWLVYSHFPSVMNPADTSAVNLANRLEQKLVYIGQPDVIQQVDWLTIAANRTNRTCAYTSAFAKGRTENLVKAEKAKYTFRSAPNPLFAEYPGLVERYNDSLKRVLLSTSCGPGFDLPRYEEKRHGFLSEILRMKEPLVELRYEKRDSETDKNKKESVLVSFNHDFCDYTVRANGQFATIPIGKRDMRSLAIGSSVSYRFYRGKALADGNPDYPYALPVASGSKTKFILDPRERYLSYAVSVEVGEPVCAMRAGRVCLSSDENAVIVSHEDGTFAAYLNISDLRIAPGSQVRPGDVIGTCGIGRLSISIFYLDTGTLSVPGSSSHPYTHLTPIIRTAQGDVRLEEDREYEALTDIDLITKEMSAAQKRRYLK